MNSCIHMVIQRHPTTNQLCLVLFLTYSKQCIKIRLYIFQLQFSKPYKRRGRKTGTYVTQPAMVEVIITGKLCGYLLIH